MRLMMYDASFGCAGSHTVSPLPVALLDPGIFRFRKCSKATMRTGFPLKETTFVSGAFAGALVGDRKVRNLEGQGFHSAPQRCS